jgi:uncharacterized protein (TIGR04255 family)
MGIALKNPPVYFTLAQVKFNPVSTLETYIESIQEKFRVTNFPDYQVQQDVTIQVTIGTDGQQAPTQAVQKSFLFGDIDKTHVFVLSQQGLTLQSTNYGTFKAFSETFLSGLKLVHEVLSLSYVERIGLRYLDRVTPQNGEEIGKYLEHSAHALTSKIAGKSIYTYTEAKNEIGQIALLSRAIVQEGALSFPPDLQPGQLRVNAELANYVGIYALLDNDGSFPNREAFDLVTIKAHLDEIHDVVSKAFKAMTTDHARETWNK